MATENIEEVSMDETIAVENHETVSKKPFSCFIAFKIMIFLGALVLIFPILYKYFIGKYVCQGEFESVVYFNPEKCIDDGCGAYDYAVSELEVDVLPFVLVYLFSGIICYYVWKCYIRHKFTILHFSKNKFNFLSFVIYVIVSIILSVSLQYIISTVTGNTFCSFTKINAVTDVLKPIIYLYPTETTDVSIKLGAPEKLTHTYPKYVDEWKVRAEPNGNLTDAYGRHYYSLYWEGKNANLARYDDGFVVAKDKVVPFLEEKLAVLGLNEREANEFIIYWRPKLESAPYAFIHFVSMAEQNANMPLNVTPQPDTVIRVLMAFRSLEKPIEVQEQILPVTPQRSGFTVIEWGGTEIGSGLIK